MKWIVTVFVAAVVLVVLGVVVTGTRNGAPISDDPQAVALCEEGTEDAHAFRLRDAVRKLTEALERDPSLAEASISRLTAYYRLGERDNAVAELSRADSLTALIEDDERRLLAQLRLSSIPQSRFRGMRDSVMTRVTREMPDNIYVLEAQAAEAQRSGDDAAIEAAWKRIVEKDPNYANSYNMLGYFELHRGNFEQAIDYMQRYAFLAPDLANPHDSLGDVYLAMGRYEEAEAEFRTAVTMQPDFYASLINLAVTYLNRGQVRTGVGILEKMRDQVAGSDLELTIDWLIASNYLVAGMDEELDRASAELVARHAGTDLAAHMRAMRLAHLGRHETGRALLDSCAAADDVGDVYTSEQKERQLESVAYQYEGVVADLQGDHARAADYWAKVLAIESKHTPDYRLRYPRTRLAAALREAGRPREALAEVDSMLVVNPRVINALIVKVKCHLDLQEGDAARAALEQLQWSLSKADPDYPARAAAAELERRVSALAAP